MGGTFPRHLCRLRYRGRRRDCQLNRTKKATLLDVAHAAGVSRTTASYILGKNGGSFSAETVERVHRAARDLGFRPNVLAKWLRTGRPRLLGFLTPVDLESANHIIKHQFEVGIAVEARAHGMDLVKVLLAPEAGDETGRIADLLDSGLIESLILENPPLDSLILPLLKERNAMFVVFGNPQDASVPSVDTDNVRLGRAVAGHLLELGHRRLAYLAPMEEWVWGNDRVQGFREACLDAGVAPEDILVLHNTHSMAGGYKGMQELLASRQAVTAVACADDPTAYGALRAISDAGLSVPEDYSVAGCNNDNVLGVFPDLLTTIDLDFVSLGAMAARKAIAISEGQRRPAREYNEFKLIARLSTGRPRS